MSEGMRLPVTVMNGHTTMRYPPDRFRIVQELTRECFDYHPVWSEYYDFDERDEIESWGVDRAWLDATLRDLPDHPHPHYTILVTDPLPDRMRLFIKARFRTPNGNELAGYIMNTDAFVIGIYVGNNEFGFSAHPDLRELMDSRLHELRAALGDSSDPLVPLHYSTDFAGGQLQGRFEFQD